MTTANTSKSTFTLPTIHLNGTGRQQLQDGYNAAYRALIAARGAFAAIEFHQRDYYVQPANAWYQARSERDCALRKFDQLADYLEAHLLRLSHD